MAGDWIKVRHDLPGDPAVVGVAAALGMSEDEVVGKLVRLWIWADQQCAFGDARNITEAWLDVYVRAPGFAKALKKEGWLRVKKGGISFPKWDRHHSKSAKKRALQRNRMKRSRDDAKRTKSALEKRREEKSKKNRKGDDDSSGSSPSERSSLDPTSQMKNSASVPDRPESHEDAPRSTTKRRRGRSPQKKARRGTAGRTGKAAAIRQQVADLFFEACGGRRKFDPRGSGTRKLLDPLLKERLELNDNDVEVVMQEFRIAFTVFARRYLDQKASDGADMSKYFRPQTIFQRLKFEEALALGQNSREFTMDKRIQETLSRFGKEKGDADGK